jgi:deoxycytidine triphosphate deaminase
MSSLAKETIVKLSSEGWSCDDYPGQCTVPGHKGNKNRLLYVPDQDPLKNPLHVQFSGNAVILHFGKTVRRYRRTSTERETVVIPPGKFYFFLTKEAVNLPMDVEGSLFMNPKVSNLGLLFFTLGHIAPGFHGYLTATVLNVTDRPIVLDLERPEQGPLYLVLSRLERSMSPHPRYHQDPQLSLDVAQRNVAFNLSPAFAFTKSTFVTRAELYLWLGILLAFVTFATGIVALFVARR